MVKGSGIDWLAVSAEWEAEGMKLSKADLELLASATGRFVKLPNSGWVELDTGAMQSAHEAMADMGVEGLIHKSQIGYSAAQNTQAVIKPGDRVILKVLEVNSERKRVALSMRQVPMERQIAWAMGAVEEEMQPAKKAAEPVVEAEAKPETPSEQPEQPLEAKTEPPSEQPQERAPEPETAMVEAQPAEATLEPQEEASQTQEPEILAELEPIAAQTQEPVPSVDFRMRP